jgi:threonine dehydrogenase-like Zn-dependent dehydrogenase
MSDYNRIIFSNTKQADYVSYNPDQSAVAPDELVGKTVYSLISPGTELAIYRGSSFPAYPGYAAVCKVEHVGTAVSDLSPGDYFFCMGHHQSHQRVSRTDAIPIPKTVPLKQAALSRLMCISMTTLFTTRTHPPDSVFIMGLGPVGFLAGLLYQEYGYHVYAYDPQSQRCAFATRNGLASVYDNDSFLELANRESIGLVLECSGHEQAVLNGCNLVRKGGEVVLIGVPWERKTGLYAHDILHAVFHRYVYLHSGWEWELPRQSTDFQPYSIYRNIASALNLLASDAFHLESCMLLVNPEEAQTVYQQLQHQPDPEHLFIQFTWEP